MKKFIQATLLSLAAISLSACSDGKYINMVNINKAQSLCKNNEGVKLIEVFNVIYKVTCINGANFVVEKANQNIQDAD